MNSINKLNVFFICFIASQSVFASCRDDIVQSTPTSDFNIHNDGTVTHIPTGLMWKVCAEDQIWSNGDCTFDFDSEPLDLQQALQIPEALNISGGYAGHTDWRLPNVKELLSIQEFSCTFPTINEEVFPNVSGSSATYISSSPYVVAGVGVWSADFEHGGTTFGGRQAKLVRTVTQ